MIELDRRETEAGVVWVLERRANGATLHCLSAGDQSMIEPQRVSVIGTPL